MNLGRLHQLAALPAGGDNAFVPRGTFAFVPLKNIKRLRIGMRVHVSSVSSAAMTVGVHVVDMPLLVAANMT